MKKAVALAYKAYQDHAPKVVARGKGEIANKIIQKAQEFNIPLFQNIELVENMINLEPNTEVSPKLYQSLVSVFIWLNECEEKAQLSKN